MRNQERKYQVDLLVSVRCEVRAYDEINAERQAIENHPHLKVKQVRVRRAGLDTGFYTPPYYSPRNRKEKTQDICRICGMGKADPIHGDDEASANNRRRLIPGLANVLRHKFERKTTFLRAG